MNPKEENKKNVLILGASSETGKVLLTHLQKMNNLNITCYIRSPEKLNSYSNIIKIKGDVTDKENLSKSMKEKDIIICLLSGDKLVNQAENIINCMKENKINRIIWMTGMGIHHEVPGPIKEILDKLVEEKPDYVKAADLIMNSGLNYTLLRGAHLTDGNNIKYFIQKEGEPLNSNTCDRIAVAEVISKMLNDFKLYEKESIGVTN